MTREKPTILIIDDEEFILDRLTRLLQDEFTCHTAKTAKDGLELFDQIVKSNPLVICDVNLPDIVGFDICRTIKSQHPKTYVLLFTGFNSNELRIRGLNAYADNCLDKTLGDSEIKLLIRNAYNTMQPHAVIERPVTLENENIRNQITDFETEVNNYISSYYKKPVTERSHTELSLGDISAYFNLVERTFQRKFKSVTGASYIKYLAQKKLEKSKELLAENVSITDISEMLEYSSPSHYSREFKKSTSMTPNKYKSTIRSLQ